MPHPHQPAIRLPAVLAIGFRGDPTLRDEPASRLAIRAFLTTRTLDSERTVCGVSGLATPADLLFAESCTELRIPLRILLATHRDRLQQQTDPTLWPRIATLIDQAISVEVLPDSGPADELSYQSGIEVVERSQILLTLSDSCSSTESIVAFARELGRPVLCFGTAGEPPSQSAEQAIHSLEHDPELHFLTNLPDENVTLASDSPTALAQAWFDKVDRNANRLAPQVLRLAWLPILCTAAAAFTSGAGAHGTHARLWLITGAILGLVAAALPAILRLGPRQALWARSRFAAEVCRSILTLWDTPAGFHAFTPEMIPELAGMLRALDLLKALAGTPEGVPIDQFKTRYLKDRVRNQIRYFAKTASRAATESRRFRLVGLVAVVIAIAISAYSFVGPLLHAPSANAWFALAASALFQVSAVAGALRIVNDCDRRQRRYREIGDILQRRARELSVLQTWPPVLQAAARIERALLVELIEWRSLIQNIKMPRN